MPKFNMPIKKIPKRYDEKKIKDIIDNFFENNLLEKGVGGIFQRSDWVNVRKKYAEIFYKITKSPLSKIIFKIKRTYIQLSSGIENSYIIRDDGLSSYLQNYHEPKFMDILIRKILSFFVAPKPKKQNH